MALSEALDLQDLTPAVDQAALHPAPAGRAGLAQAGASGLIVLFLIFLAMGSYSGIVYWALQGSLGGVLLSAVVPGFGAASLLLLIL